MPIDLNASLAASDPDIAKQIENEIHRQHGVVIGTIDHNVAADVDLVAVAQKQIANCVSQMRVARSKIASNTGWSSPGELEITCSTSEVAVCCSSASERSAVRACTCSNKRAFPIAITA